MTASIYAKSNGTQGVLQVNGVDSLVFDPTGLVSGDTNTLNKTLGYGQTWQAVTRPAGTTFYNTTGKPIKFRARGYCTVPGEGVINMTIGPTTMPICEAGASTLATYSSDEITIPIDSTYSYVTGNFAVLAIYELR